MKGTVKAFNYSFTCHKMCYSKAYYITQKGDSSYEMLRWRRIAASQLTCICDMWFCVMANHRHLNCVFTL
jgi:hypothetical protein